MLGIRTHAKVTASETLFAPIVTADKVSRGLAYRTSALSSAVHASKIAERCPPNQLCVLIIHMQ